MGINNSSNHESDYHCNGSKNQIEVIHYSTAEWIWSEEHDAVLANIYPQIPTEIIKLIKDHSFNDTEHYKIIKPVIRTEKCVCKPNQLLRKKLCPKWYTSHLSDQSVPICLYVSNIMHSNKIFDVLKLTTLPSLQLRSKYQSSFMAHEQIWRTMYIDDNQIRLHLLAINNSNDNKNISKYSAIHMIVIHENDALVIANQTCQMLWNKHNTMQNCILVKIKDSMKSKSHGNSKAIDELATNYNIPCISVCLNDKNTVNNVFNLAIKYYCLDSE